MRIGEAHARCWAEIDLNAVRENYARAKTLVPKGTKVVCVLKGNAYGLGAKAVGRVLAESGADFFAVATADEALELRETCPNAEILVLGLTGADETPELIRRNITLTLFSRAQSEMLSRAARTAGAAARVHVKADTGLYRLGFSSPEEAVSAAKLDGLRIEGLFTHLALHDRASDEAQFARFDEFRAALTRAGIPPRMAHALDSIGMVRYPERAMDAVRIGAWLYGNCPARYEHPEYCRPTVRLCARIAQIHEVRAGERVGYDDTHVLARDSRIATLTIGYADGAPRYNHVGEVVLRGRRAPVFGLACMDQMMIDATDISDAAEGDVVTLLGDGISIEEYASWTHLNRNEALARLGRRVARVYLNADGGWL